MRLIFVTAIEKLQILAFHQSFSTYILYIYTVYTVKKVICRSFFRVLNSKLEGVIVTDDELSNCKFDLTFYCYMQYTTCVQHSSDKIAKCKFTYHYWFEIQSTLSKMDTIGTGLSCPSQRGVRLIESPHNMTPEILRQ